MTFEQWWAIQIKQLPNIDTMMNKAIAKAAWDRSKRVTEEHEHEKDLDMPW